MKKPVNIQSNRIPNLLQSTLVALRIGNFDKIANPENREAIVDCVTEGDRIEFQNTFKELSGVSSSTWFALLYQIPAYLAEDNVDSLKKVLYMRRYQHPWEVISKLPQKRALVESYMPESEFERYVGFEGPPPPPWPLLLNRYLEMVLRVYDEWFETAWHNLMEMMSVQAELVPVFDQHDWIEVWEKKVDIDFPYPRFDVELTVPVTTQGTSLLAERDGFYAFAEPLSITTMVSHEICTHLLFNSEAISHPTVGSFIEADMERYLRANELVSWSLNKHVMEQFGFEWTMKDSFEWMGETRNKIRTLVSNMQTATGWELIESAYNVVPPSDRSED